VNLILFESSEINQPLARSDRRATHILDVLRRRVGDSFDAGVINGPRGQATLKAITAESLVFAFPAHSPVIAATCSTPVPITLIVGLPRPQTARDILRDATTLGVAAIHFVRTEKSDANYARSTLWCSGEWRRHVIVGAEQAFDTRLPDVTFTRTLPDALSAIGLPSLRVALDNYESSRRLGELNVTPGDAHVLAIGAERGWSAADREMLRAHRFTLAHLGSRVLRTETATVAALSILRLKLGLM
jgi:16S rRNA (uracil1498-N3)-methyltransferase